MNAPCLMDKQLVCGLGEALSYPTAQLDVELDALALAAGPGGVREAIRSFQREMRRVRPEDLAEIYTRTFDVAPTCIPYVSIHLFGEESFHRARLMCGLRGSLHHAGVDDRGELPDHLAVLLRAAPSLDSQEWDDLVDFVLRAAVHAMWESHRDTQNPYRWLLDAVRLVVGPATEADLDRLKAARRDGKKHVGPGQVTAPVSCGS